MAFILVNTDAVLEKIYEERLKSSYKGMLDIEEDYPGEIKGTIFIHNGENYWTKFYHEGEQKVLSEYVKAQVKDQLKDKESPGVKQTIFDLEKIDLVIETAKELSNKARDRRQSLKRLGSLSTGINFSRMKNYNASGEDLLNDSESMVWTSTQKIGLTDLIKKIYKRIYGSVYTDMEILVNSINEELILSFKEIMSDLLEDISEIALSLLNEAEKDLISLGVKLTDFDSINKEFTEIRTNLKWIRDINNNGI